MKQICVHKEIRMFSQSDAAVKKEVSRLKKSKSFSTIKHLLEKKREKLKPFKPHLFCIN